MLIGHQENINAISQYLEIPYQTGNYPKYYVQGTSGFIFTLNDNDIIMEYLYLNPQGEFVISPYTTIKVPQSNFCEKLVTERVNY